MASPLAQTMESAIRSMVTKGVVVVSSFRRSRQDANRPHAFLTGIHAPVKEERTIEDLAVTGTIPAELSGRYVRIGPNPFRADPRGHHWFVGDGMVHGVCMKGGKALWYRNRYVRSRNLQDAGGPAAAPGPRRSTFDTVNTNVIQHAGRTFALVEAGSFPVELTHDLESFAYSDLGGTLKGPFSAHPHLDPLTGELHAVTYDGQTLDTVWHVVVDREGRVRREEPVPVAHGPSIHDCAITAKYVLILDLPVTFSMAALVGGARFPYRWNPAHRARVGLLPREGTAADVIWCDVDAAYVFHVANAFDNPDGTVTVDLAAYETMFAHGPDGPNGKSLGMERWTVDPAARKVARKTLDAAPQEFHRPDERFFGQPYRFAWSMGLPAENAEDFLGHAPIYGYDLATGQRSAHDFGPGKIPGEFVFIPRRADAEEGDGWLMGYVIDLASETTDLAILDARNLAAPPLALIHIPCRIPPGFHGNWLPDAAD
ncbi:carotenoid cleavage dioxygenase [Novosphingobium aromaticivorans]|nr:carotenoid cleavage dioxygenase [Novosphingobium aromaticivorans]